MQKKKKKKKKKVFCDVIASVFLLVQNIQLLGCLLKGAFNNLNLYH